MTFGDFGFLIEKIRNPKRQNLLLKKPVICVYVSSKCRTLRSSPQTVSIQAQPVRYKSQQGHKPTGFKCHTGTQA